MAPKMDGDDAEHRCPTCGQSVPSAVLSPDRRAATPGQCTSALLILVGALEAVLTSGVVFGWAPLQMMLQEEGIYGDVCTDGPPCQEQAVRLQIIYTVATSAFCFCVWPTGLVLDAYGPRACCMMGAAFFGVGTALMARSDAAHDLFMPGFVLMAVGGLPVVLSMMHLSELIPALAGTIMTIFNVMIDVSSLDLQLFHVVVSSGWCTRQQAFGYYTAVPLAIFVTAPFLWPNQKFEQPTKPPVDDVIFDSPRGERGGDAGHARDSSAAAADASSRKQWLKQAPFGVQMTSKEFVLCVLFTALQLLHINLYIGTVDNQLEFLPFPPRNTTNSSSMPATTPGLLAQDAQLAYLQTEAAGEQSTLALVRSVEVQWFGSGRSYTSARVGAAADDSAVSTASQLCQAFAWILPLGGLAMTWPVGAVLDSMPLSMAMFMLSLAAVVHGVLALPVAMFASRTVQLAGFLVFAYYRAALFGTMATTVAFSFGHGNFGKLWGLLYAVSGCFNFGIASLAMLAKTMGSYLAINVAVLVVSIALMSYSHWLRRQELLHTAECAGWPAAGAGAGGREASVRGFGNDEYSSHSRPRMSDADRVLAGRQPSELERGLLHEE